VAKRVDKPARAPLNAPADPLDRFLHCVTRLGFKPRHVVDVGANVGSWTRGAQRYFPDAYFTLLEPNPRLTDGLVQGFGSNARVKVHAVGAGAADGSFPFMLHERNDSGSFAPTPEQADAKGFPQVDIPVVRVDTLLATSDRPPADMLKIDAEGLDLEVIEGARKTIAGCEIVLVEAGIMNKAMRNDLKAVVDLMTELGFRPFDIVEFIRTREHDSLWLIEMAFVRRGGHLDGRVTSY
jgi:FkbM family methyltransferase